MSNQPSEHPFFGEVISVYTRAQALADGVLIDAGPMAREAGFRWPVAITAGAWADCVTWSDADSERQTPQDQSGRLWDVLFMAAFAARADANAGSELLFELYRVPRDGNATRSPADQAEAGGGPWRRGRTGHDDPAPERGLNPPAKTGIFSLAAWVKAASSYLHPRFGMLPVLPKGAVP